MSKFKVGDRVRTLALWGDAPIGSEGTIRKEWGSSGWYVDIPHHPYSGQDPYLIYPDKELELTTLDTRDDALDRIADVLLHKWVKVSNDATYAIYKIIRETGRMQ